MNTTLAVIFAVAAVVVIALVVAFSDIPIFWFMLQIVRTFQKAPEQKKKEGMKEIDQMNGGDFERWCASLLQGVGFTQVEVTSGSNDQGVDITAVRNGKKYAIQCKRYSKKLGNKPIQEVYAGKTIYRCDVAAALTNNYFTEGAKEAAKATGVELWDRDTLRRMMDYANFKALV